MNSDNQYKKCTVCNTLKQKTSEFPKNGKNYRSICKICHSNKEKIRYKSNRDNIIQNKRVFYDNNKEYILDRNKTYRDIHKESIQCNKKEYYTKNRERILLKTKEESYKHKRNKYLQNKRMTDKKFCLVNAYRARLNEVLCKQKRNTYIHYLDCTRDQLLEWIEFQFKYTDQNISWETYGKVWVLDHVIPIAFFNLDNEIERSRCFNWYNLRPLYTRDNLIKSSNIDFDAVELHSQILQEFRFLNKWYQTDVEIYQWLREKTQTR